MKSFLRYYALGVVLFYVQMMPAQSLFQLNADGYFHAGGTDVMAFSDFYPEGHQGGVSIIINGKRLATNGVWRRLRDNGNLCRSR